MRHRRRDIPALRQPGHLRRQPYRRPEELLQLLDAPGLQRHETAPFSEWHEVPDELPEDTQYQVASRACAAVHLAGYRANIGPTVVDEPALVAALVGPARQAEPPQHPAVPPQPSSPDSRRSR
nr:hypothetical protein OH826_19925 [Streptomyces sp. NBC_00899]